MKKVFLTLLTVAASLNMMAMSVSKMRDHARFITDRMAYELDLNSMQYEDCYEINFDFIYAVDDYLDGVARGYSDAIDLYYTYLDYRNEDLYNVLTDAQYAMFQAKEYFYRPIYASSSRWYFRIYTVYDNIHFFYRQPPICFRTYIGAHCRRYYSAGFYVGRHYSGHRAPYHGHIRGGVHFDNYRGRDFGHNIRHREVRRGDRGVRSGRGNDVYYRPGANRRDNVRDNGGRRHESARPQGTPRHESSRSQGTQRHESARPQSGERHEGSRSQNVERHYNEGTQSTQRTERTQPSQRTERTQPAQRAERTQPTQRTERTQSTQRTERTQSQQRTERSMPTQRTERSMPSQRTERSMPSQRTERSVPSQRSNSDGGSVMRGGGSGGGAMRSSGGGGGGGRGRR